LPAEISTKIKNGGREWLTENHLNPWEGYRGVYKNWQVTPPSSDHDWGNSYICNWRKNHYELNNHQKSGNCPYINEYFEGYIGISDYNKSVFMPSAKRSLGESGNYYSFDAAGAAIIVDIKRDFIFYIWGID
jgi:hypothetical protein